MLFRLRSRPASKNASPGVILHTHRTSEVSSKADSARTMACSVDAQQHEAGGDQHPRGVAFINPPRAVVALVECRAHQTLVERHRLVLPHSAPFVLSHAVSRSPPLLVQRLAA